jgi:hypothetical protein
MEQWQVQIKEIEYESQQRIIFLNDYQTCSLKQEYDYGAIYGTTFILSFVIA